MKHMRQLMALLLVMAMIICLGACGSSTAEAAKSAAEPETTASDAAPAEEASAPAEEAVSTAEEAAPVEEAAPAEEASEDTEETADSGYVSYDLPLAEGNPTVSIWSPQWFGFLSQNFESYSDTEFWQLLGQQLGVNFKFAISMDAGTDLPLIVASGQAFDIMQNLGGNYAGGDSAAIRDEYVVNLINDLDELPNYATVLNSDPNYLKNATTDEGDLAAFYTIYENVYPQGYLWIYKDWMEECGFTELPETIDEYHDVLAAMHNKYGYAPLWIGYTGGMEGSILGSAYGVNVAFEPGMKNPTGLMFSVDNGEVQFSPFQDGLKSYLETLSSWWSEGLIYKDFMSGFDLMGANDYMMATGIGLTPMSVNQYAELSQNCVGGGEWTATYTPVVNKGDTVHLMSVKASINTGSGWYVPSLCEQQELVLKILDYFYSPEGQILSNYGFEGKSMHFEDGQPVLDSDAIYNNPEFPNTNAARVNYLGVIESISVADMTVTRNNLDEAGKNAVEIWTSNQDSANMYPASVSLTDEELQGYNQYAGDVFTYIAECLPRFIIGEMSMDQYDEFVEKVEQLGGNEILGYYQAAYDRFMAR